MSTLTTRNQLRGGVTGVNLGSVMAEVTIDVQGAELVAVITRHSAEDIGISKGDEVTVLIKATEVMLAKGSLDGVRLTTRNQVPGTVSKVVTGSVMGEVTIATDAGVMVAAVTLNSIERLGLTNGDAVVVLVKATEVMLSK